MQVSRFDGLGLVKERVRDLRRPAVRQSELQSPGGGVDPSALDVPAILVRFRAVKGGALD